MRVLHTALTAALLGTFAASGCQCITDTGIGVIPDEPDAGLDEEIVPPVFPLKAGDELELLPFGGRTDDDVNGGSDFAVQANFVINSVALNADKRWEVNADVLYEVAGTPTVTAAAISRLALENAAPFAAVEANSSNSALGAIFTTDVAPALDGANFKSNNFPFFQGGVEGNDGDDGEVFNEAAAEFRETFLALDEEAQVDTQISVGKFEVYFRDDLGGPPMLHNIKAEVHPMGFMCGWTEVLVPFVEGSGRNQAAIQAGGTAPLSGIFAGSPRLTRDDVTYTCSCFSGQCRSSDNKCLDPLKPDAEPATCP